MDEGGEVAQMLGSKDQKAKNEPWAACIWHKEEQKYIGGEDTDRSQGRGWTKSR